MDLLKKIWRPLLAFLLILVLIKKGPFDVEQLKFILRQPRVLTLGFVIFFLQIIIFSLRWRLFIDLVTRISFGKIVQLNMVGAFFNYFIPGGVGGDLVKAYELSKDGLTSKSQALSTVMSDRVFGLFSMVSFTFLFLAIDYSFEPKSYILKFLWLSAALFAGLTTALLFFPVVFTKLSSFLSARDSALLQKVEKLVASLHFTFVTFRNRKIQIRSFFLSLTGQILAVYFMYEVVQALGVPPPSFPVFFALCCFGFVASAIPIFPAGIGVGQYASYVMFSNISPDLGKASITAVTALQIFNLFYALIGGAIFSFMPKIRKDPVVL